MYDVLVDYKEKNSFIWEQKNSALSVKKSVSKSELNNWVQNDIILGFMN